MEVLAGSEEFWRSTHGVRRSDTARESAAGTIVGRADPLSRAAHDLPIDSIDL
jgi:hypothetical protein